MADIGAEGSDRRRVRRRSTSRPGNKPVADKAVPAKPVADAAGAPGAVPPSTDARPVRPRPPAGPRADPGSVGHRGAGRAERGLRAIVGAGPSQLGVSAAMRARDVARPTEEELAAAEADPHIVRRHYVPPPPHSS